MLRSMYAGISGLRNHQTRMDIVGNNIANVNTVGFKKSRVTFQDILSQTIRGGSRPDGGRGGTNPQQVGLGMSLGSIDKIHTPGNLQSTGKMSDLAIEGDGFFLVGTADGLTYYTRAGAFTFDRDGNYVDPNGMLVKGWMADENGRIDTNAISLDSLQPIRIPVGVESGARATTMIDFNKNLDSRITADKMVENDGPHYHVAVPMNFYDENGRPYDIEVLFKRIMDDGTDPVVNEWQFAIRARSVIPNSDGTKQDWVYAANDSTFPAADPTDPDSIFQRIAFDDNGNLKGIGGTIGDAGNTTSRVTITDLQEAFGPLIVGDQEIELDLSKITQLAAPMSVQANSQNGYPSGTLQSVTVDSRGVILGVYSNGQTREMAQVAMANFNNPAGLISAGGNLYTLSNNSGNPQIGTAGTGGRGTIAPGSLEMSNVDLSEEFVDMITTQRGFQANSRIITTSDEMLQELVNLKR